MNRYSKLFDRLSGNLFILGLITAKARFIPVPLVSTILGLTSPILYLIGYLLWFIAAQYYRVYPEKTKAWYTFSPIRNQHRYAALIGFFAMSLSLIGSLAFPFLLIPGAWLFMVSNLFWSIAEYHKLKNPPNNQRNYADTQQSYYLAYALLGTFISLINAVSLTLAVLFPPVGIAVGLIASIIVQCLTCSAIYFLYQHLSYPENKKPTQSPESTEDLDAAPQVNPALASLLGQPASVNQRPPEQPGYSTLYSSNKEEYTLNEEDTTPHHRANLV